MTACFSEAQVMEQKEPFSSFLRNLLMIHSLCQQRLNYLKAGQLKYTSNHICGLMIS